MLSFKTSTLFQLAAQSEDTSFFPGRSCDPDEPSPPGLDSYRLDLGELSKRVSSIEHGFRANLELTPPLRWQSVDILDALRRFREQARSRKQYADCGLSCVNEPDTRKIPVRWDGVPPKLEQTVRITGVLEKLDRGLVFSVKSVAEAAKE